MLARFIYPPVTASLGRITRVGVLVAFCFHAEVGEVATPEIEELIFVRKRACRARPWRIAVNIAKLPELLR